MEFGITLLRVQIGYKKVFIFSQKTEINYPMIKKTLKAR